jgi:hypothetical protein
MAEIYNSGNSWQRNRYKYMSELNKGSGIQEYGHAIGGTTRYFHLISEKEKLHNFLNDRSILEEVEKRFKDHKAGDKHRVLTNTVASQPCCFNLFVPIKNNLEVASRIISKLLNKNVTVNHIEIEFTPNTCTNLAGFELSGDESLGDQANKSGTDADVAIFYSYGTKKGLILIEFKYIESEFSQCGSFKAIGKNSISRCTSSGYYDEVITQRLSRINGKSFCGYLRYNNWKLTSESKVFDLEKIKNCNCCPFRFSGQQLWRNMLLAENVANQRNLDEFHFWVLSPVENKMLWNGKEEVEAVFRSILTPLGNSRFRRLDLDNDFFNLLKPLINDDMKEWARKFEERYLKETK